jgi:hypothetical protein
MAGNQLASKIVEKPKAFSTHEMPLIVYIHTYQVMHKIICDKPHVATLPRETLLLWMIK